MVYSAFLRIIINLIIDKSRLRYKITIKYRFTFFQKKENFTLFLDV